MLISYIYTVPLYRGILVFMIILGCSGPSEIPVPDRSFIPISVNVYDDYTMDVQILKVTPLETSEDAVVGKAEKILFHDHQYYLLDYQERDIKIFDVEGKYVETLSNIGRGRNEYIHLTDINIRKDINSLDMLDPRGKIVRYNLKNRKFTEDILISTHLAEISTFQWVNSDTLVFGSFFQDTNIMYYSVLKNRELGRAVPSVMVHTNSAPLVNTISFWRWRDQIHYIDLYNMETYVIRQDNLEKKYKFDFGENQFTFDEIRDVERDFDIMEYTVEHKKAFPLSSVYENEKYFVFGVFINEKYAIQYFGIEKSNPEEVFTINLGDYKDNLLDFEAFALGLESDHFIACVSNPLAIPKLFENAIIPEEFSDVIDEATDISNPYLIEYTLVPRKKD